MCCKDTTFKKKSYKKKRKRVKIRNGNSALSFNGHIGVRDEIGHVGEDVAVEYKLASVKHQAVAFGAIESVADNGIVETKRMCAMHTQLVGASRFGTECHHSMAALVG